MAFRDPTDNITLTMSEQADALREFHGPSASWDKLTRAERIETTLAYVARHPDAHPDRRRSDGDGDRPFSDAQADLLAEVLYSVVPQVVREFLDQPLDDVGEFRMRAELREMVEPLVEEAVDARRAVFGVPSPAFIERIDSLERSIAKLAEDVRDKLASLDRRVSRHAEHLQKIEDSRHRNRG